MDIVQCLSIFYTTIFVFPWKMVSVSVRYLFYQPMDEKIKTQPLRFPAKENPNMVKALFDWQMVLQYDVKGKYRLISRKFSGMKFLSPERSLNQTKATRACIRSINQSNRSISVRLFFLLCSRVFISRSYENRWSTSFGDRSVRDTKKQPWPPYFEVILIFKICLVFSLFGSLSPGKTYFV